MFHKQYASLIKKEGKGVRFYSTSKKPNLDKYSGLERLEVIRKEAKKDKNKIFKDIYKLM